MNPFRKSVRAVAAGVALIVGGGVAHADVSLLNVSYDPTRELYAQYNVEFAKHWKETTGETVTIQQSHGGSGAQARSIIDGLEADVATLALAYDIDAIADQGKLIPADWQSRLPHNSAPYTSTIVFLVRKGNPKGIKDWSDLVKPGVEVITPNPKTSGGARWNYLAAWGWSLQKDLGDFAALKDPAKADKVKAAQANAESFVAELYRHVPVLDSGARGSTNTFVQRGIGDVLLAWENEAFLAIKELGPDALDIVVPSISILAEPPVTVIDKFVDKHKTRKVATAYLEYLYSPAGQQLAAKNYYRPIFPEKADAADVARFPNVKLFRIEEAFGTWRQTQADHFNDGGVFDRIYAPSK